jgi:hypothetical protein
MNTPPPRIFLSLLKVMKPSICYVTKKDSHASINAKTCWSEVETEKWKHLKAGKA